MDGWIKLHRKFIGWEWYDDINTKIFFLHILLIANHKSIKWRGIIIPRGGTIRTLETLSNETGLSKQNIRTAIKKLKSTQELTQEKIEKHWVITINNYDTYQSSTQELTQHQHDTNTQSTLNKNDNNKKNENNIEFKIFWDLYNKKVGDKKKCKKKWDKLDIETQQKIIDTLPSFLSTIKDKQFQPYPETYLNNERRNDEIQDLKNGVDYTDMAIFGVEIKKDYQGLKAKVGKEKFFELKRQWIERASLNNKL